MATVYLDGEFLPADQARVPVLDRGFLLGDGVYEVIPVFGRRPFRLAQHLQRLAGSLAQTRIAPPLSEPQWRRVIQRLVASRDEPDQAVYLQVTRGVAPREHGFPEGARPTVLAMTRAIAPPPDEPPPGIRAILQEDQRWQRCDIKSISLLANVLHTQAALDAGAGETLLVRKGQVWEGASSNVFAVVEGRLTTPPHSPFMLAGITRDLLVELCRQQGLACTEAPLAVADLERASEIWISSSTREMVPVLELAGRLVSREAGPVFRQLWALYVRYRSAHVQAPEQRAEA